MPTAITLGVLDLNEDPAIAQLQKLVELRGGQLHRLSLNTVPEPSPAFSNIVNELGIGAIDVVMFRTAAGVAQFIGNLNQHQRQRVIDSLSDAQLFAASAKAAVELRNHGLAPVVSVDADSSWRNVLKTIDEKYRRTDRSGSPLAMLQIALEDCGDWFSLSSGLEARGARVRAMELFPQVDDILNSTVEEFFAKLENKTCEAFWFQSAADAAIFWRLSKQFGRARLTDRNCKLTNSKIEQY